ncbi:hypothetical protein HDU87_003697 [Geranomyces variabilis]|uniref:Uncharacterized protein n=1 Tax=Geranomyces variabilis TaxID=109894 RepID=A0AAD5TLH0_9FUNG|nr:hypothetical protein HDU87_003697 [Geranomyces variabilis]
MSAENPLRLPAVDSSLSMPEPNGNAVTPTDSTTTTGANQPPKTDAPANVDKDSDSAPQATTDPIAAGAGDNADNDDSAPPLATTTVADIDITAVRVVELVQAALALAAGNDIAADEQQPQNGGDDDEAAGHGKLVQEVRLAGGDAAEEESTTQMDNAQQTVPDSSSSPPPPTTIITTPAQDSRPQTVAGAGVTPRGTQQSFLPRHVSRRHSTATSTTTTTTRRTSPENGFRPGVALVSPEPPVAAAAAAADGSDNDNDTHHATSTIAPSSRATTARSTRQSSGRRTLARKPGTPMTVFTSAGLAFEVRPDRHAGAHADSLRAVLASNTHHTPDTTPPKGPELPSIDTRPQPSWFRTRYAPPRRRQRTAGAASPSPPSTSSKSRSAANHHHHHHHHDDEDADADASDRNHECFSIYSVPLPLTRASSAPVVVLSSSTACSGGTPFIVTSDHQQRQQRRHRLLRALRARRDAELQEEYLGFPGVEAREFVARRMRLVMMAAAAASAAASRTSSATTTPTVNGGGGFYHDAVAITADAQALAPTVNISHPCAQTFGQLGRVHWREADVSAPRCHSPQYFVAGKKGTERRRRKAEEEEADRKQRVSPPSPPTLMDLVPGLRKAPKMFPHQLKRVTQSKYVIPPMDG